MATVVHTWEQHVLGIFVFIFRADYKVGILLILRGFLLTLPDRLALRHHGTAVVAILLKGHLGGVGLSVEQRTLSVLLTSEVVAQGEDIFW